MYVHTYVNKESNWIWNRSLFLPRTHIAVHNITAFIFHFISTYIHTYILYNEKFGRGNFGKFIVLSIWWRKVWQINRFSQKVTHHITGTFSDNLEYFCDLYVYVMTTNDLFLIVWIYLHEAINTKTFYLHAWFWFQMIMITALIMVHIQVLHGLWCSHAT